MADVELMMAERADLAEIVSIYNHYVKTGVATFDLEIFATEDKLDWFNSFNTGNPYELWVAKTDRVIGYAYTGVFRVRPAYNSSCDVSIYMHPDFTGKGVGSKLFQKLIDIANQHKIHRLYSSITLPNDASMKLHEKFDFYEIGRLSEVGYKFDRYWDVAWLERRMNH